MLNPLQTRFSIAPLLYIHIYAHMYTYNAIYVYVLISHAPPYTRNSFHIPIIYIESSDTHFRRIADPIMHNIAEHSLLVQRGRRSFNLVTSIASLLEYRELIEAEGTFE